MPQETLRVVLFANGELPRPDLFINLLNEEDVFIAVDGGLAHMTALGLTPSLIIGDLDSADPEEVRKFQSQGGEVRKFPIYKDETDLELAVIAALEMDPDIIWIAGALGKRLDQTLGSIFLLTQPALKEMNIRLVDGCREVFLIHESTTVPGAPGQRLSLLPLNGPAEGVCTTGLKYPLKHETLLPEKTRGISNSLIHSSATITLDQGTLLCIHQTFIEEEIK